MERVGLVLNGVDEMAIEITGFVKVELEDKTYKIGAEDFSCEESDDRHIGDGDFQYECLYVYHHSEGFSVMFQLTMTGSDINIYEPNATNGAIIIVNQLNARKK